MLRKDFFWKQDTPTTPIFIFFFSWFFPTCRVVGITDVLLSPHRDVHLLARSQSRRYFSSIVGTRLSTLFKSLFDIISKIGHFRSLHCRPCSLSCINEYLAIDSTVEPLTNDHPHQRPSLSYDHISCDGQWFLFVYESLTRDHPSYTTTPM